MGIAHDRYNRDACVQRFDQGGDQVDCAGPKGSVADARCSRNAGVSVGGETPAAFVIDQMVPKAKLPQSFIEREELESTHAEHGAGLMYLKHFGERASARHGHIGFVSL